MVCGEEFSNVYSIQGFYRAFGMGLRAFSFSFTIVISIYILVQTIYNISITYYCQSLVSVVASINTSAFMICSTVFIILDVCAYILYTLLNSSPQTIISFIYYLSTCCLFLDPFLLYNTYCIAVCVNNL